MTRRRPIIIAHRGFSAEAPENTLASLRHAADAGADCLEFDVQLSKDEVPILLHDNTVGRTTNASPDRPVSALTLVELKQLDVGSWFSPAFAEERIPSLQEVLAEFAGKIGLFIELKEDGSQIDRLVEQVKHTIAGLPSSQTSHIVLGSFSPYIVKQLQRNLENQPLLGIAGTLDQVNAHKQLSLKHLAISDEIASPQTIQKLRDEGILLWVYTVDDPDRAQALANSGVDGIISNTPHTLLRVLSQED